MAYPTTLDSTTTIPVEATSTPLSTNHVTNHTAMQTAIIAIETLMGVTASAVTGTFNYILGEITGSDKAVGKTATQTLTNKTLGTGTKVTIGSDADKDMYYRASDGTLTRIPVGTDNQILKLNGTTPNWEAETVTVNGSTTVAGIFEEATQAEVLSETGTGSTGARLIKNPTTFSPSIGLSLVAGENINAGQTVYAGSVPVIAVSYDTSNTYTGSISTTPTQTVTQSFTIGNNTNRYLLVSIFLDNGNGSNGDPTITAATYGGVAMTLLASGTGRAYIYGIASPTVGANDIVLTITNAGSTPYFGVYVFNAYSFYNTTYAGITSNAGHTVNANIAMEGGIIFGTGANIIGSGAAGAYTTSNLSNNYTSTTYSGQITYYSGWQSSLGDITGTSVITTASTGGASTPTRAYGVNLSPSTAPTYGVARLTTTANPNYTGNRYLNYLGFATNTVTTGQTVNIKTNGLIPGLSGLTPNAFYYLNDTAGTIGSSAGANSKKVGIAVSSTQLLTKDSI